MARLVKVKLAVWPACFHFETRLLDLVAKNRYMSIFRVFDCDLDVVLVGR
jgi:hypothetical protein